MAAISKGALHASLFMELFPNMNNDKIETRLTTTYQTPISIDNPMMFTPGFSSHIPTQYRRFTVPQNEGYLYGGHAGSGPYTRERMRPRRSRRHHMYFQGWEGVTPEGSASSSSSIMPWNSSSNRAILGTGRRRRRDPRKKHPLYY